MFLRDPILELQLYHFREKELQEAAMRDRLIRLSARRGDGFRRRLVLSIGDILVALGEKLRDGFDEPTEGAAA